MDAYALVAAFYDAEHAGLEADAAFVARHAVGGPLLVLGCGTGRVCRLLGGERPVTGLDRSEPMLAIARRRVPTARFALGDMRGFSLGRFHEIVVPNASFSFLPTRADQLACLSSCAAALRPGDPLWLDLPMPDFSLLGAPHTPERPAWEGEVDGRAVHRTREVHRAPTAQRLELVDRYYVDGTLAATSVLKLRHVYPAEAEWMLETAGFWLDQAWGDYAGNPVRERCPRLLLRAVRA